MFKKAKSKPGSKRIDVIDGLRFLFILFIMMLHFLFVFGDNADASRGRAAYVFVEAFLIITGYFTARHFQKIKSSKIEESAKNALEYTFKKFGSYLPYVFISVIIGFLITFLSREYNFMTLFLDVAKMPLELFYNSIFYAPLDHCGPLWYLSGLFIVFPLFCLISQFKDKNFRNIFLLLGVLVFIFTGSHYTHGVPALIRIFTDLAIGLLVFDFSEHLKVIKLTTLGKKLFQLIESFSLLFVFFVVMQHGDASEAFLQVRFDIFLAFFVFFTLVFSEQTYSSEVSSRVFKTVGKFTLPLFLIHENVAFLLRDLELKLDFNTTVIIYYIVSILLSVIIYYAVEGIRKKVSLKKLVVRG